MQILYSDPYKGFSYLQFFIRFAGIIGVFQSLVWFALSIIGITAYYCVFDKVPETAVSVGTITQQTFYHMYFGDCVSSPSKIDIDYTALDRVPRKLNPSQINTWIWVYFAIHIVWFLSSVSLLRRIDKSRLVLLNTVLLIWVIITLAISAMDLGLGILFGMDYGDLLSASYNVAYNFDGETVSVILAGMTASITMMIVALRGFILWLVNVGLLCYFFSQAFAISKATTNLSGQDNEGFISETQSDILRQPIDAYSTPNKNDIHNSYPAQLNVEPLKRANAMSVDSLILRHYQRYPPGNDTKDENLSQSTGYKILAETNSFKPYPTVPDPDYSPQMEFQISMTSLTKKSLTPSPETPAIIVEGRSQM